MFRNLGPIMKLPILLLTALALSGCALFGDNSREAFAGPSAAAATVERGAPAQPFRAAYGIGRPVALVPCGKGARIGDDCSAGVQRHQIASESDTASEGVTVVDASATADPD